jgi:hypothetical protein
MDDWLVLGLGYRLPLSDRIDLTGALDYQSVELNGNRRNGGGVLLGVRARPFDAWELGLQVGYFDLVRKDTQVILDVAYRLTNRVDFVGRIRDFADWNYTSYEAGLRYRF